MTYFLAKTEPATYSISQLLQDEKTTWDGVKNAQALKTIRGMKPGDRVLIYHSGGESAVVGWAKVVSDPRPDPKDAKLAVIDLAFGGVLDPPTPLSEIKASGLFADFALVRQSRLSTMEAPGHFIEWLRARYPKTKF